MGIIRATDRDGSAPALQSRDRASLMELLRHAGLSVEALCSGCCQCATCHAYIGENWLDKLLPPTELETATLKSEGLP